MGIESYWLFNLVAAYEVSSSLRLRLNVNNLLDEEYFASVNNNGGRFNPGAPRNFLLSAEMRF